MEVASSHPAQRRRSWLGGLAASALGAVLVVIGLTQTTASNPNVSCPAGLDLVAKFEVDHGRYSFEKPSGNEGVVTITNGSRTGGDMRSTRPISVIIIKGGSAAVVVTLSPPQTSAHFSNSGLPEVGNGNIPDISNVQFCGDNHPPTTTTTSTTSTSSTSTTSTSTTSTSTTVPPTPTDEPNPTEPTPTDEPTTTTTVPGTTTTTTTTLPPSTTTTIVSSSSTTPTTQPSAVTTTTAVAQEAVVTSTSIVTGLPIDGTALPRTGSNSVPLIALGLVLVAVGVTFMVIGRASERRATR